MRGEGLADRSLSLVEHVEDVVLMQLEATAWEQVAEYQLSQAKYIWRFSKFHMVSRSDVALHGLTDLASEKNMVCTLPDDLISLISGSGMSSAGS